MMRVGNALIVHRTHLLPAAHEIAQLLWYLVSATAKTTGLTTYRLKTCCMLHVVSYLLSYLPHDEVRFASFSPWVPGIRHYDVRASYVLQSVMFPIFIGTVSYTWYTGKREV